MAVKFVFAFIFVIAPVYIRNCCFGKPHFRVLCRVTVFIKILFSRNVLPPKILHVLEEYERHFFYNFREKEILWLYQFRHLPHSNLTIATMRVNFVNKYSNEHRSG